jgi:ribosome recycling factor
MFDTNEYKNKFEVSLKHVEDDMSKIRTGRAHPGMLSGIIVEVYGTRMPLNQTATTTVLDAHMLQVAPFDPSTLNNITKAIRSDQSLGFNPSDDGHVIRVPVPMLTEESRKNLVKQVSARIEEAKIGFRAIRQEAMKELKNLKQEKSISEDEQKRLEKQLDTIVEDYNSKIEQLFKTKEKEILTI